MAAVKMYIDKFDKEVLIDEDHPLAIAQQAKGKVSRLDSKPIERGEDGLVHGDPLNISDEERAALPPLEPAGDAPNELATGSAPPRKRRGRR
jgi:hypothetical protein